MRVLFIFAHPDDAEIYSGGLIAKLYKKKIDLRICCIKNKQDENRITAIRKKEFFESMKKVEVEPDFMDIKDGKIFLKNDEIEKIRNYIYKLDPYIIVTHNNMDYHADHRQVSELVHKIASYRYPVIMTDTLCGNMNEPRYYCNITNFMNLKIDMLKCYKSQILQCDYIGIVKILNSFRALQYTGRSEGYYEAYSCVNTYHSKDIDERIFKLFKDE